MPVTAPLKAGLAEDIDYSQIHVAGGALRILKRIQVNGYPQEWVEILAPVRCWRKEKHPPKLVIFPCSPAC